MRTRQVQVTGTTPGLLTVQEDNTVVAAAECLNWATGQHFAQVIRTLKETGNTYVVLPVISDQGLHCLFCHEAFPTPEQMLDHLREQYPQENPIDLLADLLKKGRVEETPTKRLRFPLPPLPVSPVKKQWVKR